MTEPKRFVRRNRVDERAALAIALSSGLIAAFAGAAPTGGTVVDVALVVLAVGAVVWASASAPWWASAGACGVGAAIAMQPVVATVGLVGFVAGLSIGIRRRDQPEMRALAGGIAANVLIRSELEGFFGLSAIIGLAVLGGLFLVGLRRRRSAIRRNGWRAIGLISGLCLLALAGLTMALLAARPDLTNASRQSQAAIDALNAGDYDTAAEELQRASTSFARANNQLGGLLALPSRLLPVVAQNVDAAANLADEAEGATSDAAGALREIEPETLRFVSGAVDLDAIVDIEAPLVRVQEALTDLSSVADEVDSSWLLDRVKQELSELEEDLDDNEPRLQNAIDAVRLAPRMLGAEGERTYLILFTTPSEARGLGGFVGNYAEVTITDGRLRVTEFARRSELDDVAQNGAFCTGCPQELLDRYGRFGFTSGPGGGVQHGVWQNITMPAHFPYVAEAAAILYPQSGGKQIDGVLVLDPYVVEALMQYTGPIEVPEFGVTVTPGDAAQFIIEDQYLLAGNEGTDERIDALQTLGESLLTKLLFGSLPPPADLAESLSPLVEERRLLFWTNDLEEQDLLGRTGLLGALPELGDDGGFSVAVSNASGNKIEIFLEQTVDVRIDEDSSGNRQLIADVTLTNGAPSGGLPNYVIGNSVGLDPGSSRLFVSFYGPPTLTSVVLDGVEIEVEPAIEAGWFVYGDFVDIGPGASVKYALVFDLEPVIPGAADGGGPIQWTQPLVRRL